ncbi:putative PUA-like superfamily, SRA-YDG superfamily protein [Septoria linicola]|nr:putative PUA-like superfamily, SRA-YDG superfamily protein [Septoria linicola]
MSTQRFSIPTEGASDSDRATFIVRLKIDIVNVLAKLRTAEQCERNTSYISPLTSALRWMKQDSIDESAGEFKRINKVVFEEANVAKLLIKVAGIDFGLWVVVEPRVVEQDDVALLIPDVCEKFGTVYSVPELIDAADRYPTQTNAIVPGDKTLEDQESDDEDDGSAITTEELWVPSATHPRWGDQGIYRGVVKVKTKKSSKSTSENVARPGYSSATESSRFGDDHLPASVRVGTWLPTRMSIKVHGLHGHLKQCVYGDTKKGVFAIVLTGATMKKNGIEDYGSTIKFSENESRPSGSKYRAKQDSSAQSTPSKLVGQLAITTPVSDISTPRSAGSLGSGKKRTSDAANLCPDEQSSKSTKRKTGETVADEVVDRRVSPEDFKLMSSSAKSLQKSFENGKEVRIIRGGPKREASDRMFFPISFSTGFRYDGLYRVERRQEELAGAKKYWTFSLTRVPGQTPLTDLQAKSPSAKDLDDDSQCKSEWRHAVARKDWTLPGSA